MTPCTPVTQTYRCSPRSTQPATSSTAEPMVRQLIVTPRTSTRGGPTPGTSAELGRSVVLTARQPLLDPSVGGFQPVAKGCLRLPIEHLAQQRVVGVTSSHALRARHVDDADVALSRQLDDELDELRDGDHVVGAEIQRLAMVGLHDPVDPLDAVVDVAERA